MTFTVNSTLDDGSPGTLRDAIIQSNGQAGADMIDLTGLNGMITLTSGLPTLTESVTFNGPGVGTLTISGDGSYRIFFIDTSGTVSIQGISFLLGSARGGNGGRGSSTGGGGGGGVPEPQPARSARTASTSIRRKPHSCCAAKRRGRPAPWNRDGMPGPGRARDKRSRGISQAYL
jgi:hypothetical protein